jgi:hypothetical protein
MVVLCAGPILFKPVDFLIKIEVKADDGVFPTAYKIQKKNMMVNEANGLEYG